MANKMTRERRRALQEEQAKLRKRLAEIKDELSPRPVSEEARIVLASKEPMRGTRISEMTGKSLGATVNALTRADDLGIIKRISRGLYGHPVSP